MKKPVENITSRTILFLAVVISIALISPDYSFSQNIVISEIMFNPDGDENAREYVEIFNLTESSLSLEGFSIGDGEGFDNIIPEGDGDYIVTAGSYALIIDPGYFLSEEKYDDIPNSVPLFTVDDNAIGQRGLSNSTAETVYIVSSGGDTLSAVCYSIECAAGYSWEKIILTGSETIDNFKQSLVKDGTPGKENSVVPSHYNPAEIPPGTILLNEVMAAPEDGNAEWIEIFNSSESPVDLFNWKISDSTVDAGGIIGEHVFIDPKGYAVISGKQLDSTNSPGIPDDSPVIVINNFPTLNNDGDTISLFDYGNELLDSMSYENVSAGHSFERISSEIGDGTKRWDVCVDTRGSTPGAVNSIDNSHTAEINTDMIKLTVSPNPFSERTTISYTLSFSLSRVNLYVYDRRGRLITKIRDAEESGSRWSGEWNGRSDGTNLPAGPYILNIEALDKSTGAVHTTRTTIVIGRNL